MNIFHTKISLFHKHIYRQIQWMRRLFWPGKSEMRWRKSQSFFFLKKEGVWSWKTQYSSGIMARACFSMLSCTHSIQRSAPVPQEQAAARLCHKGAQQPLTLPCTQSWQSTASQFPKPLSTFASSFMLKKNKTKKNLSVLQWEVSHATRLKEQIDFYGHIWYIPAAWSVFMTQTSSELITLSRVKEISRYNSLSGKCIESELPVKSGV